MLWGSAIVALAVEMVEVDLAESDVMRGHFDIFVFLDIFERLFEREDDGGHYPGFVVGTARTHIGEFLRLGHVDDDVVVFGVLADYLTGINFFLREDEEAAAILKLVDGVGVGCSGLKSDKRAVGAPFDVAFPGLLVEEAVRHDGLSGRRCQNIVAQSDDAP